MSPLVVSPDVAEQWRELCLSDFECRLLALSGLTVPNIAHALDLAHGVGVTSAYEFACFLLSGARDASKCGSTPWWVDAIHIFWPAGKETDLHQMLHDAFARQADVCLPLLTLDPQPDLLQKHGIGLCQFNSADFLTQGDCVQVPLTSMSAQPFAHLSPLGEPWKAALLQCRNETTGTYFSGLWNEIASALHVQLGSLFPDDPRVVALNPQLGRYSLALHGSTCASRGAFKYIELMDARLHQLSAQVDEASNGFVSGDVQAQWGWHFKKSASFELLLKPRLLIREVELCRERPLDLEGSECFVSWRIDREIHVDQPLRIELPLGALAMGQALVSCEVTVPVVARLSAVSRVGGPVPMLIDPHCGDLLFNLMAMIDPASRRLTIAWRLSQEDLHLRWTVRKPLCGDSTGTLLLAAAQDLQNWSSETHG